MLIFSSLLCPVSKHRGDILIGIGRIPLTLGYSSRSFAVFPNHGRRHAVNSLLNVILLPELENALPVYLPPRM